jgi:flagellar motor switch protein FliG
MKFLIFILSFSLFAAGDPYASEAKIQSDLENALARLIPREQFLVQVTAEIGIRTERKIVEGETVIANPDPEPIRVAPLPGFVPEVEPREAKKPLQNRQMYRMVDVPYLAMVQVKVDFDDSLPVPTIARGKNIVQSYLKTTSRSAVTYGSYPMLQPPKPVAEREEEPKRKPASIEPELPKEPSPEEKAWNQARWAMLFLLVLTFFLQFRKNAPTIFSAPSPAAPGVPSFGGFGGGLGGFPGFGKSQHRNEGKAPKKSSGAKGASLVRRRLLEKCIGRSEAFRFYYQRLTDEDKNDLYGGLKGPGYEKLLEGLGIPRPAVASMESSDLEEKILILEKNFEEFSQAKEWRDKQFFGFLETLSDEQLITLVNHEVALNVCIMLRFMKPHQSAFILDALSPVKRREVLALVHRVKDMHFSDLLGIERDVRANVMKMPSHLYGSKKEDIDFWGNVLSESHDQDTLLADMEKTNPEIFANIAKFKFRLEDAASLPDNLLNRVLSDVDNDELALALAGVESGIAEVFLDSVPTNRRNVLEPQLVSYRRAPKEQVMAAKLKLTRKIREVMS